MALQTMSLSGQVIMSPENRAEVLDGMEGVLENASRPMTAIGEHASPFYIAKDKPKPVVVQEEAREEIVEEEVFTTPVVLSDEVALGIISRRFKPLGSMVLGNRGFLQLPQGRTIEKGQKFKADIKGTSYEVLISEVTAKGYTLQLGSASSEHSFIIAGTGQ